MSSRSASARFGLIALICAGTAGLPARADVLHVVYKLSLIGLPIGAANLYADLSPTTYSIKAEAKLTGLAKIISNARGASAGDGAIAGGKVLPATFATIAASPSMTRTIRMAIAGNKVTGVDVSPPFADKPDRVPLGPHDQQNIVDPVGAVVVPGAASGPLVSPEACNRKIPIFDGYTRFDIDLTYVGQRKVKAKGYDGPVAVCAARYVPISGHSANRPATKFMADNKDLEVWLAPVESDHILMPFRISAKTMVGTAVIEASEFRVDDK